MAVDVQPIISQGLLISNVKLSIRSKTPDMMFRLYLLSLVVECIYLMFCCFSICYSCSCLWNFTV